MFMVEMSIGDHRIPCSTRTKRPPTHQVKRHKMWLRPGDKVAASMGPPTWNIHGIWWTYRTLILQSFPVFLLNKNHMTSYDWTFWRSEKMQKDSSWCRKVKWIVQSSSNHRKVSYFDSAPWGQPNHFVRQGNPSAQTNNRLNAHAHALKLTLPKGHRLLHFCIWVRVAPRTKEKSRRNPRSQSQTITLYLGSIARYKLVYKPHRYSYQYHGPCLWELQTNFAIVYRLGAPLCRVHTSWVDNQLGGGVVVPRCFK